jgi:pre-rRNA-processing protein IPI3
VTAIASGFGGSNIISCSLDCTCKFWSLAHDATPIRTVSFPCMLWCLALDSTESNFYVGGSNGRIYVGSTKANSRRSNPQMLVSLSPQHNGAVTAVAMVNEGQNLVSASEDGSVCIWDVDTGMVVRVIGNGRETISDIVVARGIRNGGCSGGMRFGAADVIELRGAVLESGGRVMDRPVRELAELEESLKVVVRDRRRALDTLEGTIDTYQRLLGLILKELKVATGGGDDDDNNKDKSE